MRSSMIRLALVLGAATVSVSCAEPFGPHEVAGTYVLAQVAGNPLPAVVFSNGSVTIEVYADTLRLTAEGRGTMVRVSETRLRAGGPPPGPGRTESSISFAVVDGRIEIAFDCPANANCVPPPHLVARRIASGLEVVGSLGERMPQRYTSLPPEP